MFYEVVIEDVIRIPPDKLRGDKYEAIYNVLRQSYVGLIRKELGLVVSVTDILDVGEGLVIPEDGGVYYRVKFKAIVFRPELNELVLGYVTTITDFGAFINIGPIDGLCHVSQVMDDEVAVSKECIQGKNTRKVLKVGDIVRARIISISYKDPTMIRVGLTMRQPRLGKIEWLEEKTKEGKS